MSLQGLGGLVALDGPIAGAVMVANAKVNSQYVDHLQIQIYSDSAGVNLVDTRSAAVTYNASTGKSEMVGAIVFEGLTAGWTYYVRIGTVAPRSGFTTWSALFAVTPVLADFSNGPTYAATYFGVGSGISVFIEPNNVPGDVIGYDAFWTFDGTSPPDGAPALWTGTPNSNGIVPLFVGGKPGDTITVWLRAFNQAGQKQAWTGMGNFPVGQVIVSTSKNLPGTNLQAAILGGVSPLTSVGGGAGTINIATHTVQFGFGQVTYQGGSITGLAPGTYYVYCDDPNLSGGTVVWKASTQASDTVSGDYRWVPGFITVVATSGAGGTSGGGTFCTLYGTWLQTQYGPMPNYKVYDMWVNGELLQLEGPDGLEDITRLEWQDVTEYYEVEVEGFRSFRCSTSHNVMPEGATIQQPISALKVGDKVLTKSGFSRITKLNLVKGYGRVLEVSLAGPHHTYWVEDGIWAHNMKVQRSA